MIESENKVRIHEENGKDIFLDSKSLKVSSCCGDCRFINLIIDGKSYKILARDLETAIKNATNI